MKVIKTLALILSITPLLLCKVQAQSQFTNGLVAYYLLASSGNASVNDSSGNGNNGLIVGHKYPVITATASTGCEYCIECFGIGFLQPVLPEGFAQTRSRSQSVANGTG